MDDAVCIRHWDWSETSQTVSLFARNLGVLRAIAKGAKRERAPFSGGIDILTRGQAVAILKPNATLATLTAWDLQETFPGVRRHLNAHLAAIYMIDLIHHTVKASDPHPLLFDHLLDALRAISDHNAVDLALLRFQCHALTQLGLRAELSVDVRTGEPLATSAGLAFAPAFGGLTQAPTTDPAEERWRVRSETVELLRAVWNSEIPPDAGPDAVPDDALDASAVGRANRLLASYVTHILGHALPSVPAVFPGLRLPVPRGRA
jgi:DNA repair protein RecO